VRKCSTQVEVGSLKFSYFTLPLDFFFGVLDDEILRVIIKTHSLYFFPAHSPPLFVPLANRATKTGVESPLAETTEKVRSEEVYSQFPLKLFFVEKNSKYEHNSAQR
jgi:hypothetical protein